MIATRTLSGGLLAALCCTASAIAAPQEAPGADQDVVEGVDLYQIIGRVADKTGRQFIYQARVRKVKIYGHVALDVPPDQIWAKFHSILELNGLAIATIGRGTAHEIHKIVDARNMRRYPSRVFDADLVRADPSVLPETEEVVTVTVRLRHASAREVSNALRPLIDPNTGGQIIGIDNVEALIITDFAPNVRRLLTTVDLMDKPREVPPAPELTTAVVALKFARAIDVAAMIRNRFNQAGIAQAHAVTLDAVPGTNGVAVAAPAEAIAQARAWIAAMDVDPKGGK